MSDVDTKNILDLVEIMKGMKSLLGTPPNPYLPVYSALGGAFIGAVSTFIPTTIAARLKDKKDRKSMSLSIYAEIKAVLEIIQARSYIENIKTIVAAMERGDITSNTLQIIIPDEYCAIYKNNSANIGIIEPLLLVKVVKFYHLLDAVIQDVKPGGMLNNIPRGIEPYKELITIGTHLSSLGQEIVSEIETKYRIVKSDSVTH